MKIKKLFFLAIIATTITLACAFVLGYYMFCNSPTPKYLYISLFILIMFARFLLHLVVVVIEEKKNYKN